MFVCDQKIFHTYLGCQARATNRFNFKWPSTAKSRCCPERSHLLAKNQVGSARDLVMFLHMKQGRQENTKWNTQGNKTWNRQIKQTRNIQGDETRNRQGNKTWSKQWNTTWSTQRKETRNKQRNEIWNRQGNQICMEQMEQETDITEKDEKIRRLSDLLKEMSADKSMLSQFLKQTNFSFDINKVTTSTPKSDIKRDIRYSLKVWIPAYINKLFHNLNIIDNQ